MEPAVVGVYEEFKQRTDSLIAKFETPVPQAPPYNQTCPPAHEDAQAFLTIRLQNGWSDFCHRLVGISAQGGQPSLSGRFISSISPDSSVEEIDDQVRSAANEVVKTKGLTNPVWHSCQFTVLVARELGLANFQDIDAGLSSNLTAGYTTRVRNYLVHPAHQSRENYIKVAAFYGLPSSEPVELLRSRQLGGATLFEVWVRDLQRSAHRAAR